MPGYSFDNLVRAWAKSAFGLFVGFAFYYAFSSPFLGILAAAFFFFIPITNKSAENAINKSIFVVLMFGLLFWAFGVFGTGLDLDLGISGINLGLGIPLFIAFAILVGLAAFRKSSLFALLALIALGLAVWALQPWDWNISAILFVAVWIIGTAIGMSADNESKATVGLIVLAMAFILYTMGPGSQDVGVAFFGDWWPSVHNSVTGVFEPLTGAFSQLGKTFGDAFLLLTNPVGYATILMNGSYASNQIGLTGAYGVELTSFEVTPMLIEQPYMITANIKNQGGYDAEKVRVTLSLTQDSPTSSTKASTGRANIEQIGIDTSKCETGASDDDNCVHYYDSKADNTFIRMNAWSTAFSSDGISCSNSMQFDLRKKYIPFNITLEYKYQTDSHLDSLEIISVQEWDRLARLDKIEQDDIRSEYSSGPVKFPIGTAGLPSPIREDQDFHIGLALLSDQKGGRIDKIESVELFYPEALNNLIDKCTPEAKPECRNGACKVIWTGGSGDRYYFCHVNAKGKLGGSPTKTFVINGHANYTYLVSKEKIAKVEFGSWCCTQEGNKFCASRFTCCAEDASGKGICMPVGQYNADPSQCKGVSTTAFSVSDADYCSDRIAGSGGKCLIGWGGCTAGSDCCQHGDIAGSCSTAKGYTLASATLGTPVCTNDKICCYSGASEDKCRQAYNYWRGAMPQKGASDYYTRNVEGSGIMSIFS